MSEPTSKSPLKDKPLRRPGQSLLEERERLFGDKLEPWAMLSLFFIMVAILEWARYWHPMPPLPWLVTLFAAGVIGFTVWRYVRYWPRLKALRLAIEGERVVGDFLDRMRTKGYRVFHDVMTDGFNIDHVLVGPAGAFTIETKTRSKPLRGDARVHYDGKTLTVAGFEPDRDAIAQAKGQAGWLAALIQDTTERKVAVRPVVVFPGWYVEAVPGTQVWVLEPKALPAFVEREPEILSKDDIALVAKAVSMHVRAWERDRDRKGPLV